MNTNLREYFPIIRTRDEILADITSNSLLSKQFCSMPPQWQEEILDACSGNKGIKLLYDSFFKEIMNPEYAPERLNELLTLILGRKVEVVSVLQNDSSRIADEASLLIMDIVVKLEDRSIANIEVQKIGYKFLGEQAACYICCSIFILYLLTISVFTIKIKVSLTTLMHGFCFCRRTNLRISLNL